MDFFYNIGYLINCWWPWFNLYDDLFFIQFLIVCTYMYIIFYKNIYYILLYTFLNFFLIGICLSIFQIELFTAFLWLVECSVLFVFLLLLFFLNIKGIYNNNYIYVYPYIFIIFIFIALVLFTGSLNSDFSLQLNLNYFCVIDNYYESIFNFIQNDLFGLFISYYIINSVEYIIIGLLLLLGSVICVNLYILNKNIRSQNYLNFFNIFDFFNDFSSFFFLRRQNLIKQGNNKSSLKIFKKK